MQEGKVNGALRLSTNNLSNWIILVPYETLEKLNLKYLGGKQAHIDLLLNDPGKPIQRYKGINEFLVINGAIRTKAGCRSSSLDTSNWHRILVLLMNPDQVLYIFENPLQVLWNVYTLFKFRFWNMLREIHSQSFTSIEKMGFNAVVSTLLDILKKLR